MFGSIEENINDLEQRVRRLEERIQDWDEILNKIGIMLKEF